MVEKFLIKDPESKKLVQFAFAFKFNMAEATVKSGFITNIFFEIVQSPINLALVLLIVFLVYKIIKSRQNDVPVAPPIPELPKLKKRDFTVEELRKYDGNGEDGRVLVAVNGNVYDVTKGRRFYGPGKFK